MEFLVVEEVELLDHLLLEHLEEPVVVEMEQVEHLHQNQEDQEQLTLVAVVVVEELELQEHLVDPVDLAMF